MFKHVYTRTCTRDTLKFVIKSQISKKLGSVHVDLPMFISLLCALSVMLVDVTTTALERVYARESLALLQNLLRAAQLRTRASLLSMLILRAFQSFSSLVTWTSTITA